VPGLVDRRLLRAIIRTTHMSCLATSVVRRKWRRRSFTKRYLYKFATLATGIPATILWGAAVAIGMVGLDRYQMTPATQRRDGPHSWPSGLDDIVRRPGQFTLVMALHPRCPCSRASLDELSQLMARAGARLDAHILFVKPRSAPADWCDGKLWDQAKEISGASVLVDNDARGAAILGATTSGQVIVYDPYGTVCFNGGITDGRGHEGDNTGLSAILTLIHGGKAAPSTAPVFGCSLGVCPPEKKE
jgi:hypothetical protein